MLVMTSQLEFFNGIGLYIALGHLEPLETVFSTDQQNTVSTN